MNELSPEELEAIWGKSDGPCRHCGNLVYYDRNAALWVHRESGYWCDDQKKTSAEPST